MGLSAGAAAVVALRVAASLGPGKTVVVIFPDQGERYGSAEILFQDRSFIRDSVSVRG